MNLFCLTQLIWAHEYIAGAVGAQAHDQPRELPKHEKPIPIFQCTPKDQQCKGSHMERTTTYRMHGLLLCSARTSLTDSCPGPPEQVQQRLSCTTGSYDVAPRTSLHLLSLSTV